MKRVGLPLNINKSLFNTNNLHEDDPYMIDESNVLVIDKRWWENDLTDYCKSLIKSRLDARDFGFHFVDEIKVPHKLPQDDSDPRLVIVYQSYQDSFDFQVWAKQMHVEQAIMLRISDREKQAFREKDLSALVELGSRMLLWTEQDKFYFVRTSSTSAKNEKHVRPFNNIKDILTHLISTREFTNREFNLQKETCIILTPWNINITARSEFRVFVHNRRVCAASPQKWWECHHYTTDEMDIIEHAITTTDIVSKSPYKHFVADVYIDFEEKVCRLIELNCTGSYSGCGSSLFNWKTDADVLNGKQIPELRYISLTSYA